MQSSENKDIIIIIIIIKGLKYFVVELIAMNWNQIWFTLSVEQEA